MFSCLLQYVNIFFSCIIPIVLFLELFSDESDSEQTGRAELFVSLSGGGGSLVHAGKFYTAPKGL